MTGRLIDRSALRKLPQSPDHESWLDRINGGMVWAALLAWPEVAASARDPQHRPVLRSSLLALMLAGSDPP